MKNNIIELFLVKIGIISFYYILYIFFNKYGYYVILNIAKVLATPQAMFSKS